MSARILNRCTAAVLGVCLLAGPTRADEQGAPLVVYDHDRLSVRLDAVPLGQVLTALAHATGAEIDGDRDDTRIVSARFDAVPLPEALGWLLDDRSFTLTYGDNGALRRIDLVGPAEPPSGQPQRTVPPLPPRPPAPGAQPPAALGWPPR